MDIVCSHVSEVFSVESEVFSSRVTFCCCRSCV